MFEVCEKPYLDADREQIIRLFMSFNEPMVAPSGHPAQPTRAYIVTLKEASGFAVYIYLYLTIQKEGILYKCANELLTEDACKDAENEAIQFAEGMGHLIDDLKFNYLEISEQMKLMSYLPLFFQKTEGISEKRPMVENLEEAFETIEPVIEKRVETKEAGEEKGFEPEIFLSKFRMRAAAERMKKDTT